MRPINEAVFTVGMSEHELFVFSFEIKKTDEIFMGSYLIFKCQGDFEKLCWKPFIFDKQSKFDPLSKREKKNYYLIKEY